MLPCRFNILSPYDKESIPTLFSIPKPDIFISINNKIIPAHRNKLSYIPIINQMKLNQRICLITQQIDVIIFQQIIKYSYGHNISINDMEAFIKLQQILQMLKINTIYQQMQNTILYMVKQIDVFLIINFAYKTGLQIVLQGCLKYLEIEQFESMKIYLHSLLDVQFKLFQIVIRRHHCLKNNKRIQGISIQNIQQIIQMYCKRHKYDQQILHTLYQKYIQPWSIKKQQSNHNSNSNSNCNFNFHININKQSLRLNKLSYKNIGQSTTIYQNDSLKRSKQQQIFSPSSNQLSPYPYGKNYHNFNNYYQQYDHNFRARKYSMEIEKVLGQMGFGNNIRSNILQQIQCDKIQPIIPEEDQVCVSDMMVQNQSQRGVNSPKLSIQLDMDIQKRKSDVQKFLQDVSEIGNNGSQQLKIHQIDYNDKIYRNGNGRNDRKIIKTKSMIFNEVIQQDMEESIDQRMRKFSKRLPRVFTHKYQ